jgi:hypothetical protein
MRALRLAMIATLIGALLGCGGAAPATRAAPAASSASPTSSSPASAHAPSPLAQLLAVAACPEVEDRLVTLATGADGILDTFVLVRRCSARPGPSEIAVTGDAWIWVAVDRDLGAVRVRQFVHASLHAEARLGVRASYVDRHLELSLTPQPGAKAAIEPVGVLELSPLNWASLLAVELAPAMGTSAEWVAKRRLREETESAVSGALARPIVFAYDARRGESWIVGSASDGSGGDGGAAATPRTSAAPRLRVVPRGTALLGPYPESKTAPDVRLRLESGARVAVRTVCRSHAERLLEADRRGDSISLEEWREVSGDGRPALAPPACPWMLAMRAVDEQGAVVVTEVHPARGDSAAPERGQRWVSLDALTLEEGDAPLPVDLEVVAASDAYRRALVPPAKQKLPAVFALSSDDAVVVRAVRPGANGAAPTVVARARLPLDDLRDVDAVVELAGDAGRLGKVRVRARVRNAPSFERGIDSP